MSGEHRVQVRSDIKDVTSAPRAFELCDLGLERRAVTLDRRSDPSPRVERKTPEYKEVLGFLDTALDLFSIPCRLCDARARDRIADLFGDGNLHAIQDIS